MIRILVPLDGSQLAEQALAHAAAIARSFKAEIHLLQVIDDSRSDADVVEAGDRRLQVAEAASYLRQVAADLPCKETPVEIVVLEGRPAEKITDYSKNGDIDLIVLTAFGRGGVTEFVDGSTVHKVVSHAGVSVLLVRPNSYSERPLTYRKLLVPLDGSYQTDWALCLATSIARAHDAELLLMQVIERPKVHAGLPTSPTERQLVQRLVEIQKSDAAHHLRKLETQLPTDLKRSSRVVVAEEPSSIIEEMAQSENVGLLVLSAHGLSKSDCWPYGPVSATLLAHSTRPLLVLQDNLSADKIEFEPHTEPLAINE